jgi:cell cycle arrest protein BUB2
LILLNAPPLATDLYLELIHRGPSPAYSKIRNDTFRTLATDPLFRRRVSEASLIRMLNAVAWRLHDAKEERLKSIVSSTDREQSDQQDSAPSAINEGDDEANRKRATTLDSSDLGGSDPGTYVQGMNVLAAPFLYAARSEAEAFTAFHRFLTTECPGYIRGAMDGVHRGLAVSPVSPYSNTRLIMIQLVDKILAIVDPKLSAFLSSKGMRAELYAFPSVLTLCACTPPLPEVLRLWDFLFAYGAHLNIMCIVAQLVLIRDTIIGSPRFVFDILSSVYNSLTRSNSPTKVLRSFPPLNAAKTIALAISLGQKLPSDVYNELVSHSK